LTTRTSRPKIARLQEQPRGEALIAPGSQRPATVAGVTRQIIVPAILERILTDAPQEALS
jgi:hypothetical protein